MRIEPSPVDPAALGTLADLAAVAYGVPAFRQSLEWCRLVEPAGILRCVDGEDVVGMACAVPYPEAGFGWIGLVATHPRYERRGIATALTERAIDLLSAQGCASVLDASAPGGPVYARLGFADHGHTSVLIADEIVGAACGQTRPQDGEVRARIAERADHAAIVELDAAAFGAPRRALLTLALDDHPGRVVIAIDRAGRPSGYAIAQERTVGPVVAHDEATLTALLLTVGRLTVDPLRLLVPPDSPYLARLTALGFTESRTLRHMLLGLDLPHTDPACYVGRLSLGFG